MEIILKQDVANLGSVDDIVTVKDGYAQNYLIQQGFAITASAQNKKIHAEILRQRAHKEAKIKEAALVMAEKLKDVKENSVVLIDEPELSLSVPWQKEFLVDIVGSGLCVGLVAVTHSPFIYANNLRKYATSMGELVS